jgi:hypothetical protein
MKARLEKMTRLVLAFAALGTGARAQESRYPQMAPLDQYMMKPDAEIALARSAAPESISRDAEIMILAKNGYKTAAPGKNGFLCIVERSWTAGKDDPDFWNPKLRGPICFNPAAVRSYLPQTIRKTQSIVAGRSKSQMFADLSAALDKKEIPGPESGAMCYMMSKDGYLGDSAGHWHPHLMFFLPLADPVSWGAGQHGSPIIGNKDVEGRMTVFIIPVGHWSDGTAAPPMEEK